MKWGVYTGRVERLRGRTAMLRRTRGGNWVAQFDDRNTGKGYGGHFFFRRHFRVLSECKSLSHAQMRRWARHE